MRVRGIKYTILLGNHYYSYLGFRGLHIENSLDSSIARNVKRAREMEARRERSRHSWGWVEKSQG